MENCIICGQEMKEKVSFKGRKGYRNERKSLVCDCGYSTILETRREENMRNGKCE